MLQRQIHLADAFAYSRDCLLAVSQRRRQHRLDPREVIERALGRKVRAFVSGMDTNKDVSAELFYLEPEIDRTETIEIG